MSVKECAGCDVTCNPLSCPTCSRAILLRDHRIKLTEADNRRLSQQNARLISELVEVRARLRDAQRAAERALSAEVL